MPNSQQAPAFAPATPNGNGSRPVPPAQAAVAPAPAKPGTQPPPPAPQAASRPANGAAQPAPKPAALGPEPLLTRIAVALERLAVNTAAPNYKRGLKSFKDFDFARLGIRVVKTDADGPSVLEWNNHFFTRRSGKGKFGVAVWFSRPVGKGENDDDEVKFERLITFKDYSEAESMPAEAKGGK